MVNARPFTTSQNCHFSFQQQRVFAKIAHFPTCPASNANPQDVSSAPRNHSLLCCQEIGATFRNLQWERKDGRDGGDAMNPKSEIRNPKSSENRWHSFLEDSQVLAQAVGGGQFPQPARRFFHVFKGKPEGPKVHRAPATGPGGRGKPGGLHRAPCACDEKYPGSRRQWAASPPPAGWFGRSPGNRRNRRCRPRDKFAGPDAPAGSRHSRGDHPAEPARPSAWPASASPSSPDAKSSPTIAVR